MKGFAATVVLACAGGTALGQYQYTGTSIGSPDGTAMFNSIYTGQDLTAYSEAGLNVFTNWYAYQWQPYGFDSSGCYYPSGGYSGQTYITQTGGADFDAIEFQVADGWGKSDIYAWAQVLNNGSTVANFDYNVTGGTVIGIGGGGFDEVRVQAYYDAASRDAHNPSGYGAIAMDNMSYGAAIPAPGGMALLGVGALGAARRRR